MYITAFCFVDEMFFPFFSFPFCLGGGGYFVITDLERKKRVILKGGGWGAM